jgi:predicted 2-oxoglutarate/Fe(II)-dependent dioxygenase YbiX
MTAPMEFTLDAEFVEEFVEQTRILTWHRLPADQWAAGRFWRDAASVATTQRHADSGPRSFGWRAQIDDPASQGLVDRVARSLVPLLREATRAFDAPMFSGAEVHLMSKYGPGDRCPRHADGAYRAERTWTLAILIALSDPSEYEGGDTVVYPASGAALRYRPPRGGGLVFPVELEHEVEIVTAGERLALLVRPFGKDRP